MARGTRFADAGVSFITIGNGICNKCKHVSKDGQKCKAFPKGIPALILDGTRNHRLSIEGDNGITFEPREG